MTNENRDLVVFGEDWGRHPSSTQHLVSRLLARRKVLWVNSIGLRRPRLDAADLGRLVRKARSMLSRNPPAATAGPTPVLIDAKAVPWPGHPLARRINRRLLGGRLRREMAHHGVRRPILWTSLPTAVDAIGTLGEHAVVYYCGDDFGALDGVDHAAVAGLERELVARADLILAASPVLAARFPAAKTHVIEHGVDVALFGSPAPRPADLPTGRPVAGFYGSLSNWIDFELLAATARRMPGWDFVLIGTPHADLSPLDGLTNLHLLGPRDHAALPGYAQHWDASLLPFVDNAQIRACNPLKLREYLAAGTPVIATDFPALDGYRDLVRVIDGADALVAALEAARTEGPQLRAARRERVRGESWEVRAERVSALLDEL